MATNYTRRSYTASNGINLKIIKTAASNIKLVDLGGSKNLKQSGYTGINGGFFTWGTSGQFHGVMLDGSGSCQLCDKGVYIAEGDQRMLHEVIVLRNDT